MLEDIKVTLLSKEEFFKSKRKGFFKRDYQDYRLEAIKKYGIKIFNTGLVQLTGGERYYSWTRTKYADYDGVGVIDFRGDYCCVDSNKPTVGIRPVLKLPGKVDKLFPRVEHYYDGQSEFVELGEYPQDIVSGIDNLLETSYKENKLKKTGRVFHIDNKIYEEYQYSNGKKYIRYIVDDNDYSFKLLTVGAHFWVNVSPVRWLVDKTNTLISEYNLLSGVRFNKDRYDCNFENTEMYIFLNNVMFRDIFQDYLSKKEEKKENKDIILKWIKELLAKTEEIKDENDKINIIKDLMALAKFYTDELIKIKGKEPNKYDDERNLIAGIMPYCDYIEWEIKREVSEDNKDKETLEINSTIDNLVEKAGLIENEDIRLEILNEIEELKANYLEELNTNKKSYQRIDFNKPLEKRKYSNGYEAMEYTVTLTLKPTRPILIKELIAKEMAISKRIDMELDNSNIRGELSEIEKSADEIMKR